MSAELADDLPLVRWDWHGPLLPRNELQRIVDFFYPLILARSILIEIVGLDHRGGGHLRVVNLTVWMVVITLIAATEVADPDTTALGLTDGLTVELREVVLVDNVHYLAVVVPVLGIAGTAYGIKVAVYVRGGDACGVAAEGSAPETVRA